MSGVLKVFRSKKSLLIVFAAVLIVAGLCGAVVLHSGWILFLSAVGAMIITVLWINHKAAVSLQKQYEAFSTQSDIRNVDCLIIGDMIDSSSIIPNGESYVQLAAPNRGFLSDYELLRHTHSILKESGGKIYIPYCPKKKKEALSLFDYPILHITTLKKYNCVSEAPKSKNPLFYSPVDTLKFVFVKGGRGSTEDNSADQRIEEFCMERGYSVSFVRLDS